MAEPPNPPAEGRQNKGPMFFSLNIGIYNYSIAGCSSSCIRTDMGDPCFWLGWWDGCCFNGQAGNLILIIPVDLIQLIATVSTSFNIPEVQAGFGQHIYYLSEGDIVEALKWNYLATPLLVFSLAASKVSICLLLIRVLHRSKTKFKRSFPISMMILLTIVAVPSAGYSPGQCQPVRKLWNPSTPGHCQDFRIFVKFGYANGGR